jgi:hypothetical protein
MIRKFVLTIGLVVTLAGTLLARNSSAIIIPSGDYTAPAGDGSVGITYSYTSAAASNDVFIFSTFTATPGSVYNTHVYSSNIAEVCAVGLYSLAGNLISYSTITLNTTQTWYHQPLQVPQTLTATEYIVGIVAPTDTSFSLFYATGTVNSRLAYIAMAYTSGSPAASFNPETATVISTSQALRILINNVSGVP